jgi:hypothetical protein
MPNFIKICPVGAELFHADRRTDRQDEAKRCLSQFGNTPKNRAQKLSYSNTSALKCDIQSCFLSVRFIINDYI